MGRNTGCPIGTDAGTRRGTARGTDAARCWVQNQNQNQRFWLLKSVVACGDESIQSSRSVLGMDGRSAAIFGGVR